MEQTMRNKTATVLRENVTEDLRLMVRLDRFWGRLTVHLPSLKVKGQNGHFHAGL
jgi:hypothetical protein